MSTGVIIALIICATIFGIVALIIIAALIMQKKQQKIVNNFTDNFFKED